MNAENNLINIVSPDKGMNYCFNVTRYSQRFEIDEWPEGTLIEGKGSDYWGKRCCGLACLRMMISHFSGKAPSQYELLKKGLNQNAYCSKGWIHKGLAELGAEYGLEGTPIYIKNRQQLQATLEKSGPIIVSITESFPEDGRKGGHLVVVCGIHQNNEITISFRDPSKWGESHSAVTEERFFSSFTKRGICFNKR
ncbi:C39 family peptidase [Chengkuizengella sp. SCS-71B]|uniref:C39 family peptidase n=1 Tax=Chengkuizengella sp. SCS-71B TaxID=3115290 RepID=UPI0032C2498F